jgi:lipopolysaccharide export system permease protein
MKVLFITSTRLGDAVLSTGLLEVMREEHPEAKVTVVCGPLPATVFEGFPNVERIIVLKKKPRHGHWIDLWKDAVKVKWDVVIDLRNSAVSRLIRANERYIFGPHIRQDLHKVEQVARVMKLAKAPSPHLYFTPKQEAFADRFLPRGETVVGIGPSSTWIGQTWAADNFSEIARWLTAPDGLFPGARIAVFGAPGEEGQAMPVLNSIPADRRIDVIAKGEPGEVLAVLARCAFYIGNDSGLMHSAAAGGVPTFGVFGPGWPEIYRPWGKHTAYARTPETREQLTNFEGFDPKTLKHSLMGTLSVERVKQDIVRFLNDLKRAA